MYYINYNINRSNNSLIITRDYSFNSRSLYLIKRVTTFRFFTITVRNLSSSTEVGETGLSDNDVNTCLLPMSLSHLMIRFRCIE